MTQAEREVLGAKIHILEDAIYRLQEWGEHPAWSQRAQRAAANQLRHDWVRQKLAIEMELA